MIGPYDRWLSTDPQDEAEDADREHETDPVQEDDDAE